MSALICANVSAPGAGAYRISVKREPHGLVSGYLQGTLREGAVLDAAAPRGVFVLEVAARPIGGLCGRCLRFDGAGERALMPRTGTGLPAWAAKAR